MAVRVAVSFEMINGNIRTRERKEKERRRRKKCNKKKHKDQIICDEM